MLHICGIDNKIRVSHFDPGCHVTHFLVSILTETRGPLLEFYGDLLYVQSRSQLAISMQTDIIDSPYRYPGIDQVSTKYRPCMIPGYRPHLDMIYWWFVSSTDLSLSLPRARSLKTGHLQTSAKVSRHICRARR